MMIGNDGGGGKEMVLSSGGRSFQRRGAVLDIARLENTRWEVTGGRERGRHAGGWSGRASWLDGEEFAKVYVGREDCKEFQIMDKTLKWMRSGIFSHGVKLFEDRSDMMMPGRSGNTPCKRILNKSWGSNLISWCDAVCLHFTDYVIWAFVML